MWITASGPATLAGSTPRRISSGANEAVPSGFRTVPGGGLGPSRSAGSSPSKVPLLRLTKIAVNGLAVEHRRPVERRDGHREAALPAELAGGHVVGVGPHAELRVVVQRVAVEVVVEVVGAEGIAGRRDGDALVVAVGAEDGGSELGQDPPVGELVVHRDDVAAVDRRAVPAQIGEERVAVERPRQRVAGLVEDLEGEVDPLKDVVRTDRHRRVGRLDVVHVGDALEVLDRRRHAGARARLEHRIGPRRRGDPIRIRPFLHLALRAEAPGGRLGRAGDLRQRPRRDVAQGMPGLDRRDLRPGLDLELARTFRHGDRASTPARPAARASRRRDLRRRGRRAPADRGITGSIAARWSS